MKKYVREKGISTIKMNICEIAQCLSLKYRLKIIPVKIIGKRWEALSSIQKPDEDCCLPVKILLSSEYGIVVYSSRIPEAFYQQIQQYKADL